MSYKNRIGCLLAFAICAFGQPNFSIACGALAALFGYGLFWYCALTTRSRSQRFWRASLFYTCVSLVHLSWMSSIEYQGIYILFVWVFLSLWLGAQFGLLSLMIPPNLKDRIWENRMTFGRVLAISAAWTLVEWGRFYFICGYSWSLAGLCLSNLYARQFATVFGVLGLSFLVVWTNLLGLRALLEKKRACLVQWLFVACVPYLFGAIHLAYHDRKIQTANSLRCLLVQTGLLPSEKVPLQGRFNTFIDPSVQWRRILEMVHVALGEKNGTDLIVLPEATLPLSSTTPAYNKERVEVTFEKAFGLARSSDQDREDHKGEKISNLDVARMLANHLNCQVVIGLDHTDQQEKQYNCAFSLRPFTDQVERYDKRILMPLAEYLPFRPLRALASHYGIQGFFTHGHASHLFGGKVPLAPSICYEETFPHKVREGRLLGGEVLVNLTNDGWYPFSQLPIVHFEHSRLRAVENGVPLVRACNTGVSAGVDALGRTIGSLEERGVDGQLLSGALAVDIPLYSFQTPYLFWGNFGIVFPSCLIFGLFVFRERKKKRAWIF